MAHRKPLGTTFTTTMDWRGDDPYLHDGFVSGAGTWYRVVGLAETRSLGEALKLPVEERVYKIKVTLERVAEPTRDEHYVYWDDGMVGHICPFTWYPRDKRARV